MASRKPKPSWTVDMDDEDVREIMEVFFTCVN